MLSALLLPFILVQGTLLFKLSADKCWKLPANLFFSQNEEYYVMPFLTPSNTHPLAQDPPGKSSQTSIPLPIIFEDAPPPKWEYRTITIDPREEAPLDEVRLNELGADGWLLAGIADFPGGERVTRIIYYFVRFA
jgi:hypothetical protein